ncbi:transposase [Nonomuraea dietziae]|uniref:transposase n=1 Tax=Nonomuraea dietziae TaxID=65515 RepID=UPI0033C1C91D
MDEVPPGEDTLNNGSWSMEGSLRVARPSKFGEEFKQNAVRLVRTTGRTCADVARELRMNRETLHVWMPEAEERESESGVGLSPAAESSPW